MSEFTKVESGITVWGAGGHRMRDAGVEILADATGGGTIGVLESLKVVPRLALRYSLLKKELLRRRPDLFVPIDYGAFNIPLARFAHQQGIRVVYYFPPSSWRRTARGAHRLRACGGRVVTPFPWSAEALAGEGLDARFVGHPLLDIAKPSCDKAQFAEELELSKSVPIIGLLPGSRTHEISGHLRPMIGCARILHRELGGAQFVVAAAHDADALQRRIDKLASDTADAPAIRVVENRTYDCMAHSELLITTSGTATLEAAIIGTPMVIVYRGSALLRFEFLFRKAVVENHIGLPNIIAGRRICPELIGGEVTGPKLAGAALDLLRSKENTAEMKSSFAGIRDTLGEPGAVERAARAVLEMGGLESKG